MKADLNVLAKGAAFMTAGILASKVFGYVFQIFLARILGPSELGLFLIATAVLAFFVMLSNLGIADSLSRFIAFYSAKNDFARAKGSIVSAVQLHVLISLIAAFALFALSDFLAVNIFAKPELGLLLKILALTIPISTIGADFLMAMEGFKKVQYKILIRRVLQLAGKFAALLFFYYAFGLTLMAAVFAYVFAEIIAFALGAVFLKTRVIPKAVSQAKAVLIRKEMVLFAWPLLLMGVFASILVMIDVIMLGFFAPSYDAGLYGIAHTTGQLASMPLEIIVTLAVPVATTYIALKKFSEFGKIYSALSRWIFLLSLPLSVLLIAFAVPIQVFLFGPEYADSAIAMNILIAGYFLFSLFGPTQQALLAAGRTRLNFLNATIAGIIAAVLNWILIPMFMAQATSFAAAATIGAAISTMVAYFVWGFMGFFELNRLYKINPFTKTHVRIFLAVVASIAIGFFTAHVILPYSIVSGIATGIVSVLAYPFLLLVFKCFEAEDIGIMLAVEKKTGLRIEFLRRIVKRFL